LFERGLFRARRVIKESSLLLVSDLAAAIQAATRSVLSNRALLEAYIACNPAFMYALDPLKIEESAPRVVRLASDAATAVGVGPFAAVPGALADLAVEEMSRHGASVCLAENGGEVAANSRIPLNIGVYAGASQISGRIGFRLEPDDFPAGISTSSATVSHAMTFGEADAAVAFADTAALSDASATAICNAVTGEDTEASVQAGLEAAEKIPHVRGALVVRGRYVGSIGKLPRLLNLNGAVDEMLKASLHGLVPQHAVRL
jgi:ApbE superfamily uncharacterized protein (UPF0280 family)